MSATRDKTQKTAFVYSNLYQLYRKGKEAAQTSSVLTTAASEERKSYFQLPGSMPSEKNVLKSADLSAQTAPKVNPYTPPSFITKRVVQKPEALQQASPVQSAAIQSLKDNLKTLGDLHSRLKFMLEELEDLTKE